MGCLYLLSFPSGKGYIGITQKTAEQRWKAHKARSREKPEYQAVQNAIRKYGHEKVVVETLVVSDDWAYLCFLEKRAILAFETLTPKGYNLTTGGEGVVGRKMTDAQRARHSESQKKRFEDPVERDRLRQRSVLASRKRADAHAAKRIGGLAPWKVRKKQSTLKAQLGEEEFKAIHSQRTRDAAKRPEVAEKLKHFAQKRAASAEWRAKIGAARRGQKLGPMSEANKAALSEGIKAAWADPVKRAARITKNREARLRRAQQELVADPTPARKL